MHMACAMRDACETLLDVSRVAPCVTSALPCALLTLLLYSHCVRCQVRRRRLASWSREQIEKRLHGLTPILQYVSTQTYTLYVHAQANRSHARARAGERRPGEGAWEGGRAVRGFSFQCTRTHFAIHSESTSASRLHTAAYETAGLGAEAASTLSCRVAAAACKCSHA